MPASPISTGELPRTCYRWLLRTSFASRPTPPQSPLKEPYALFVGGAFYANQSGIRWFVENVVPEVSIKTCIVGRGLEESAR